MNELKIIFIIPLVIILLFSPCIIYIIKYYLRWKDQIAETKNMKDTTTLDNESATVDILGIPGDILGIPGDIREIQGDIREIPEEIPREIPRDIPRIPGDIPGYEIISLDN